MRSTAILSLLLLCACSQEPDFDERYDAARAKLGKTVSEIDAELEKRDGEAKQAEPLAGEATIEESDPKPAPPDPPA